MLRRRNRARAVSFIVASSWPSMVMLPDVGDNRPANIANIVVLPDPLGPTRATNSPFFTSSEALSTAFTTPLPT